ncbi:FAD-dependent oxidoreductase, partial [Chloroflexota bacterium]
VESVELVKEVTPFAGVLGRICTHPCEIDCQRGKFDEALPICSLKRFAADYEQKTGREKATPVKITKNAKVAIVGSGPAGLTCACDLVRQGYPVTVFEAATKSGGLMRYGIPEYRLPKIVLDDEVSYIKELGVEIKNGTPVKDLEDIFGKGYQAVFIATGTGLSQKMGISGEDSKGVIFALDFLKQVNSGVKVALGERVAVIGGGSVAIDAARSALRLGVKEVHLICLECRDLMSKDRMPAQGSEIEEAEQEGVIVHPCLGIKQILVDKGSVTGLETIKCVSVYDEDGNFRPSLQEDLFSTMDMDNVIIAVGQTVDRSMLPGGIETTARGNISVDPVTLETGVKGVFAGGDLVSGAAYVINAIADGKEAAISIDRYLTGVDLKEGRYVRSKSAGQSRHVRTTRPVELATDEHLDFAEVNPAFDENTAVEQANYCLNCGTLRPSVVIKPVDPKKQIVPWDFKRALELWQKRCPDTGEPLPDVFTEISDVTRSHEDITGRNKLVLKARNTEELMFYTVDDE